MAADSSDADHGSGPAAGQLSCSMTSVLLRRVRAAIGADGVNQLLRRAGSEHDADYLEEIGNWIPYREAVALFEAAAALTGDERIGRRVGEETVRQHAGTPVATLLRSLGSPEKVYEQLTLAVTKFSTITALEPVEVGPGRAVVRAQARPGFERGRHLCDWTLGLLSQPPALFGLPPARVDHPRCEVRGDADCLYTIAWDAERAAGAADPQQLVTALEAQLGAMAERLDSVYATARDLISLDDIDTALARITERAATAVRAPRYLLAVRDAAGQLLVHHRGFDDEDPAAAARALLDGGADATDEPDRVVADVASRTRHYGRLMAACPNGAFFPHERELLDVYARYAAAVLDTATAFDDARRRRDQAHALLALSQTIAAATTSDEVARRLAEAVPAVVDCDRVVVTLWSEEDAALRLAAFNGGDGEALRDLRIEAGASDNLARLIARPDAEPLFFDTGTSDAYVREMMRRSALEAIVVSPIVAHERFYGALTVSVTEEPERLRRTPALLERLAGVVAQVATALENARLIETMAHQARHDNLTGLLGHRAFYESLDAGIGGDPFTLATVDIDDFKRINDSHGHPVGDEALRAVAAALRSAVREDDSVFRVGGEEFSVLMPGLIADDALAVAERLREAVAAIPFTMPLRVSVGLASWPADGTERDELIACADLALYAAKRTGKDRTVLSAAAARLAAAPDGAGGLLALLRDRQPDVGSHCDAVAELAVAVGELLGLSAAELADLRAAAQLHDVGKVAIPDAVLQKPGALREDERRLVETHPAIGAELVRAFGHDRVARLVHQHHEHFDGGGYPHGLRGDEISVEARILHAADAYCAMTSDRVYRRALAPETALAELRDLSGAQFDPQAVAALERVVAARRASAA